MTTLVQSFNWVNGDKLMTLLTKVKGVVLAGRFVALQEDGDVLTC